MTRTLPIQSIRATFDAALESGPVVVSAATGSGKSTEVPRWCPRPVVIVEPRRVACRTLAARVAELEGGSVGEAVGYRVRDEARLSSKTDLLFVTPGIALQSLDDFLGYSTFVIDELHERTQDIDLLLAMTRNRTQRLVVMSATIDAQRVANALGGQHLEAKGRTFPVTVDYDESGPTVPSTERLTQRVLRALQNLPSADGDALVFLPGKGEISDVRRALSGKTSRRILELHGGTPPKQQAEIFKLGDRPRVILSTNVAETSVTVPGVSTVIDSGLVRQIRYHQGRGALTLLPVARDAAEQRAGRAGRTGPGRCFRLWRRNAHLDAHTAPEIHRTSLVRVVLAARAYHRNPEDLPWLDPPKPHALVSASEELQALGALSEQGQITERGTALFRLPIDPWMGRVIVEAEQSGLIDEAIDLAAALECSRPLFSEESLPLEDEDPRAAGCDLLALIRAVREQPKGLQRASREEIQLHRERLRRTLGRTTPAPKAEEQIDREALLRAILTADPRAARVARSRGRKRVWGGAGPELELDRRSAVALWIRDENPPPEALIVLGIRTLREGTQTRVLATAGAGVPLSFLDRMGLGQTRLGAVQLERGTPVAAVERVFAGKVLSSVSEVPEGALLRSATVALIERGRLFRGVYQEIQVRLEAARLATRLAHAGFVRTYPGDLDNLPEEEDARVFLGRRLERLGLEKAEELELLADTDLLPPSLPEALASALDRDYPRQVDLGEAKYRVRYDLRVRRAFLMLETGGRRAPPPRGYLPRFPGLKVSIQAGGTTIDLG